MSFDKANWGHIIIQQPDISIQHHMSHIFYTKRMGLEQLFNEIALAHHDERSEFHFLI